MHTNTDKRITRLLDGIDRSDTLTELGFATGYAMGYLQCLEAVGEITAREYAIFAKMLKNAREEHPLMGVPNFLKRQAI